MLKISFFQGLPGQQPGALDFPRSPQKLPSTSEGDSEASMSGASSEDLVLPPEARVAPDREEEGASKKKERKKPKGLASMFSVFSKGKKKSQPSTAKPEGEPQSRLDPDGQLPTGRLGPRVGQGSRVRAAQGWDSPRAQGMQGRLGGVCPPDFHPGALILGLGVGPAGSGPAWDTHRPLGASLHLPGGSASSPVGAVGGDLSA